MTGSRNTLIKFGVFAVIMAVLANNPGTTNAR